MEKINVGDSVMLKSEFDFKNPQPFTVGYIKEDSESVGLYWFDYDLNTLKTSEIPMVAVKKV